MIKIERVTLIDARFETSPYEYFNNVHYGFRPFSFYSRRRNRGRDSSRRTAEFLKKQNI